MSENGEDGPLISLRTRNVRVVGELESWSSYSVYNASYNESTYKIKYETANNSNTSIAQSGFLSTQ